MVIPEPIVYIVDDDQGVRESLRWLVESVGFTVETYGTASGFLDAWNGDRPGCLLLDIRMPGMDGLELQERLSAEQRELPVLVITGHGDVQMAVRAMKGGALDFIEKPFNDQMLLDNVRQAVDRDCQAWRHRTEIEGIRKGLSRLTPRENEVLALVVAGKPSRQIAKELGLSEKTVEVHRTHIMSKMEADNVADLVRLTLTVRAPNAGV